MTIPKLEVRGVHAGYGEVAVLRDVSIEVAPGSVVALLGPNGAGKTTLLRAISGAIRASEGQILLDGSDVATAKTDALSRLGVCHIPEGRGIFPSLSVRENLFLFAPKMKRDEIEQLACDAFPSLGRRMGLTAANLSGGEQQMLALSRAYLTNPQLVLVDEASMGLAPLIVDQVFEFLDRLTKQGSALLLVEQYVTRALEIADRAYVLSQGKIVLAAAAKEIDSATVFQEYLGVDVTARNIDQ